MSIEDYSINYNSIDENTIIEISKEELNEDFKIISKYIKMLDDWQEETLKSDTVLNRMH